MKDQYTEEDLIHKWLNGELSEEETVLIKKIPNYASYNRIIKKTASLQTPVFDAQQELERAKAARSLSKEETKIKPLFPIKNLLKIAAVIALLIVSYFSFRTTDTTISTSFAESKNVRLPDDSEVILNAKSILNFDPKKWDNKRIVNLEGEAYFKVAKGKKFDVVSATGTVSVLGTQFNIIDRNNFFEVTCYEGLVSVTFQGNLIKLSPGKTFLILDGKQITKTTNSLEPSWLNQESNFKSIPLKFVLEEVKRQHNISITANKIDISTLFTGTFNNNNLKLALESICTPLHLSYEIKKGNEVLLYAKEK